MVAGKAGGIPMQMPAGTGGFLVGSVEECAEKLLYLLRNPEEGAELARRGREIVRERFLLPDDLRGT
jgi:trehalose synthase